VKLTVSGEMKVIRTKDGNGNCERVSVKKDWLRPEEDETWREL
jgi:DNA-binding protein YbaB